MSPTQAPCSVRLPAARLQITINLLIEKIRRIGHGYRNYDNYRRRLLMGCGIKWTTVPTYRIRGRQPASAA